MMYFSQDTFHWKEFLMEDFEVASKAFIREEKIKIGEAFYMKTKKEEIPIRFIKGK